MAEDLNIDKTDDVNGILLRIEMMSRPAGVEEKAEMISVRLARSSSNEILTKRKTSRRLEDGMCERCYKIERRKMC